MPTRRQENSPGAVQPCFPVLLFAFILVNSVSCKKDLTYYLMENFPAVRYRLFRFEMSSSPDVEVSLWHDDCEICQKIMQVDVFLSCFLIMSY